MLGIIRRLLGPDPDHINGFFGEDRNFYEIDPEVQEQLRPYIGRKIWIGEDTYASLVKNVGKATLTLYRPIAGGEVCISYLQYGVGFDIYDEEMNPIATFPRKPGHDHYGGIIGYPEHRKAFAQMIKAGIEFPVTQPQS